MNISRDAKMLPLLFDIRFHSLFVTCGICQVQRWGDPQVRRDGGYCCRWQDIRTSLSPPNDTLEAVIRSPVELFPCLFLYPFLSCYLHDEEFAWYLGIVQFQNYFSLQSQLDQANQARYSHRSICAASNTEYNDHFSQPFQTFLGPGSSYLCITALDPS